MQTATANYNKTNRWLTKKEELPENAIMLPAGQSVGAYLVNPTTMLPVWERELIRLPCCQYGSGS